MNWTLQLPLDPALKKPLAAQIADGIVAAIRAGSLSPRDRLPGSRTLARTLSVGRNTVVAALEELAAQGWLRMAPGSGAFVCDRVPTERPSQAPRRWASLGFDLTASEGAARPTPRRGDPRLVWDWGVPDVRIAPLAELGRAYRRALTPATAGYGRLDHRTPSPLEIHLAQMLSLTRGSVVPPQNVLTTRGSLMALYLVGRALLRPGDVVAVEEPGYDDAWRQFRLAGATVVPLPVDTEGVRVEALRKLTARRKVRAVFITPHHQFPTTVTLSAARRFELLALARAQRIAVIEDDCDHEFHYEGRPVPPLMHSDPGGNVIYVGSLSKIFAPGLRLGYVVAPDPLLRELAALRRLIDIEGDKPLEAAMAELFEDGSIERHYNRSRRVYRARRDRLAELLRQRLGGALEFTTPHGGMAIWAHVEPSIDVEAWARRALALGLFIRTGSLFYLDGKPRPSLRLGFARLDEAQLEQAVGLLVRAMAPRRR